MDSWNARFSHGFSNFGRACCSCTRCFWTGSEGYVRSRLNSCPSYVRFLQSSSLFLEFAKTESTSWGVSLAILTELFYSYQLDIDHIDHLVMVALSSSSLCYHTRGHIFLALTARLMYWRWIVSCSFIMVRTSFVVISDLWLCGLFSFLSGVIHFTSFLHKYSFPTYSPCCVLHVS